jgi:iron complex transport system ATP-binding protein
MQGLFSENRAAPLPPGRPPPYSHPMTPEILFENVSFRYPETDADVFHGLNMELPGGVVSLIGQNGTGKSTLMLLAAGSLLPTEGRVLLKGTDTRELSDEEERHRIVSFVYQNMEFETEEPIGRLLELVLENGFRGEKKPEVLSELIGAFELSGILGRKTQEVSKGELQRAILAFSLLYGSPILMLDEPIFALEEPQKKRAMEYLTAYARREGVSLYYSLHELDLSQNFSDSIILFSRGAAPRVGPTAELFTRDTIEKAYEVPLVMLKKREEVYRKYLMELLKNKGKPEAGEPSSS